jgi:histone H3/H4
MTSLPPELSQQAASTEAQLPKNKGEKKQVLNVEREPGKSLFPFSRVQKIIKADRVRINLNLSLVHGDEVVVCQDLPIVAKEATFLISIATEDFIKRITEASRRLAERERRSTVQHKDIGLSCWVQLAFPPTDELYISQCCS